MVRETALGIVALSDRGEITLASVETLLRNFLAHLLSEQSADG